MTLLADSAMTQKEYEQAKFNAAIKEYLTDNLTVNISQDTQYEDNSNYLGLTVELLLDGDVISTAHTSTYIGS